MSILWSMRDLKQHFSTRERGDLMPPLPLDNKEQQP